MHLHQCSQSQVSDRKRIALIVKKEMAKTMLIHIHLKFNLLNLADVCERAALRPGISKVTPGCCVTERFIIKLSPVGA